MDFWVSLIVVDKQQTLEAYKTLKEKCTHVGGFCWIFKGKVKLLEDSGVLFNHLAQGILPDTKNFPREVLIEMCKDTFAIDVYDQSYKNDSPILMES